MCSKKLIAVLFFAAMAPRAQAYNYSDIRWKTMETQHFVIHYYDDVSWTAQKAAVVSEDIYPKVTGYYQHQPKGKTHLVIRDDEDTSNGFAVYNLNFITIWASPSNHRLRGREDWVRSVITHEFSHIVSLQASSPTALAIEGLRFGGIANSDTDVNADFGASIFIPAYTYSRWWAEGTAQLDTTTTGYDPFDTNRDMLLRASVLENNLLTFEQMRNINVRENFGGELVYNQGYAFLLWLRKKFGDDVNIKISKAASAHWYADFDRSIKKATGIDAKQLYEEWKIDLKKHYEAQALLPTGAAVEGERIALLKEKTLEQVPQAIRPYQDATQLAYPRFSPDGKWFSWVNQNTIHLRSLHKAYDLASLTEDSGEKKDPNALKQTKLSFAGRYYSWSPDSKKIVLSKRRAAVLGGYPYFDLYTVDLSSIVNARAEFESKSKELPSTKDSGELRDFYLRRIKSISAKPVRITKKLRATHPAWSPDGQWIAFSSNKDGHRDLKLIDPTGTKTQDLVAIGGDSEATDPSWSPDGKKIAFSFFHQHKPDVWLVDVQSKTPEPVTYDSFDDREPQYTADGKGLVFSSDRTGIFQLYYLDLTSSKRAPVTLTQLTTGAFMPFIPSGQDYLLYAKFSSYGFKPYKLPFRPEESKLPGTGDIAKPTQEEVSTSLKPESFPEIKNGRSYFPWLRPPRVFPSFVLENKQLKAGVALQLTDYLEKHELDFTALFGKDQDYQIAYYNQMFAPTLSASYTSYLRSTSFKAINDGDGINDEPDSIIRDNIQFILAGVSQDFQILDILDGKHTVSMNFQKRFVDRHLGYPVLLADKVTTDFRLLTNDQVNLRWSFFQSASNPDRDFDINPRNYTSFNVNYALIHTSLFSPDTSIDAPNKNYFHHESTVNFSQAYALSKLSGLRWHSLGFKFTGGYKSRDVNVNDEFYLGGRVNYRSFGQINSNTLFYGYEDFSIAGETLLLLNTNYTFPIKRAIDKKYGIFYLDSFYGSIFHEVGNVWDYGKFRNSANKDILLQDVGVELKMKAFLFNDYNRWNGDIKVAYGFQDNAAHGFSNNDSPVRVYISLGTDF